MNTVIDVYAPGGKRTHPWDPEHPVIQSIGDL
jgi:hypothetical protein